jgi:hypothetical protein
MNEMSFQFDSVRLPETANARGTPSPRQEPGGTFSCKHACTKTSRRAAATHIVPLARTLGCILRLSGNPRLLSLMQITLSKNH